MSRGPSPKGNALRLNTSFDSLNQDVKSPLHSPKSPLSGNPLQYDPELMKLMDRLGSIQSYRQFRPWKSSFLNRFKTFLTEKGIQPATESYSSYSTQMEHFEKKVNQVRKIMDQGNLGVEKTTVKGRNTLNELCKTMGEVIDETNSLIPATKSAEKNRQYNKYHLGSVLVEDGFLEYDRMLRCDEKMKEMVSMGLDEVADRQQLEIFDRYEGQIQQFVDVMRDLGLYEVMQKCRQFADGSMDEIILLDPKTGAILEFPREALLSKGVLSMYQDAQGENRIREVVTDRGEKRELISTIQGADM